MEPKWHIEFHILGVFIELSRYFGRSCKPMTVKHHAMHNVVLAPGSDLLIHVLAVVIIGSPTPFWGTPACPVA